MKKLMSNGGLLVWTGGNNIMSHVASHTHSADVAGYHSGAAVTEVLPPSCTPPTV